MVAPALEMQGGGKETNDACLALRKNYVSIAKLTRTFLSVSRLEQEPVLAKVRKGIIQDIQPLGRHGGVAAALESLMVSDERYRKIHEFGFGLSLEQGSFPAENFMPNEMALGMHFGFGLTPYTEFHLDLVCPYVSVFTEKDSQRTLVLAC